MTKRKLSEAELFVDIKEFKKTLKSIEQTDHKFLPVLLRPVRHHAFYINHKIDESFTSIIILRFLGPIQEDLDNKDVMLRFDFISVIDKLRFWDKYKIIKDISTLPKYLSKREIERVHTLRNDFAHPSLAIFGKYKDPKILHSEYKNMIKVDKALNKYFST